MCNQTTWSSEATDKIAPAVVAALPAIPHARLDSVNPHFGSSFASLKSILDAARPVLAKHNLAIIQQVTPTSVISRLLHSSGQWYASECTIKLDKDSCQGQGSAITYARRYSLAILGIYTEQDEDGEAAETPTKAKPKPKKTTKPKRKTFDAGDGWVHFESSKYENNCCVCGEMLRAGHPIDWNRETRAVRHPGGKCGPTPAGDDIPQHIKDAANWSRCDDDEIPF